MLLFSTWGAVDLRPLLLNGTPSDVEERLSSELLKCPSVNAEPVKCLAVMSLSEILHHFS